MTISIPHAPGSLLALVGRAVRLAARAAAGLSRPARSGGAERVHAAWAELKEHPALTWVPPLWRPDDDSDAAWEAALRHRVSALQGNLRVDVVDGAAGTRVRLVTGPLTDRWTADGIDPLRPACRPGELVAEGATFEDAVLALLDTVRDRYPAAGPCPPGRARPHDRLRLVGHRPARSPDRADAGRP